MKTKEEILKMSKKELNNYKWSNDLDLKGNNSSSYNSSYCSYCYDCSDCYHCNNSYDCSNCYHCSYCHDCSNCYDCSDCYHCSYCSDCSRLINGLYCRNLKLENKDYNKYYVCNVEVTKEEFEKKFKEVQEK